MHDLNQGVVKMSLNNMLKCGKIKDVPYAGRELLRLMSEGIDELKISKRRISTEEEKAKQYRDEILEIAASMNDEGSEEKFSSKPTNEENHSDSSSEMAKSETGEY